MFVNTKVVNALLRLRGVGRSSLCEVTGISPQALAAWLDETGSDDDDRLSFDRQLEVLKVLGVVGEHPRSDIVHHWMIREPTFGSREDAYEPLRLMLACFGRAEVVHLTSERDEFLRLASRTHFGLTFAKFRVVLEVRTAPFQSLSFDPETLPNLSWAGTGAALVLSGEKFRQLTVPGEATPRIFDAERILALEQYQWKRLTQVAIDRGVGAAEIVKLVVDQIPLQPALPAPQKSSRRGTGTKRARRSRMSSAKDITRPAGAEAPAPSTDGTAPPAADGQR